ncbi:GNAT family N-acetyltransferase [Flagellimonas marinaquae]|uniref:GNAT family N-acetyltransferase n=1 Tax=Flagellimonas marinaquae TaxID=254955 RepID=UPI00207591F6|nr:GNAT family N-acetyltransferase [Allomuricauda aquimarina]USD24830.1 GNAT family N-acetyltransferase [Allomuricauda aquimarina]
MVYNNNPFISETYVNKWMSSFFDRKEPKEFSFLEGIKFTKNKFLPLFYNVGTYKSCGMSYAFNNTLKAKGLKNKVIIIYDVPEYFNLDLGNIPANVSLNQVAQYEGFVTELDQFKDIEDFMSKKFPSKKRRKILHPMKQLEDSYNITYEWHFGHIERNTFLKLIDRLYELIDIKFEGKSRENSHTKKGIREWYEDLIYDMINEGKASFIVTKNEDTPIAITLNYHSDNILFSAVPGTDLGYAKYGLGSIMNVKAIEWALNNGYSYFDLSKGSYGYKHKWATRSYNFEYHVLYNKNSPIGFILGNSTVLYYKLKQYVRKKIR